MSIETRTSRLVKKTGVEKSRLAVPLIRVKSPCLPEHCSLCLGTGGSAHIPQFVVVSFNYLQALTVQVGMLKSFKLKLFCCIYSIP
jgi:hypothetical protein